MIKSRHHKFHNIHYISHRYLHVTSSRRTLRTVVVTMMSTISFHMYMQQQLTVDRIKYIIMPSNGVVAPYSGGADTSLAAIV